MLWNSAAIPQFHVRICMATYIHYIHTFLVCLDAAETDTPMYAKYFLEGEWPN